MLRDRVTRSKRRDNFGAFYVESYLFRGSLTRDEITEELGWNIFISFIGDNYLASPGKIYYRTFGAFDYTRVRRIWRRWNE